MIKIKTSKKIGYKISDIGAGGKEYNIESKDYYTCKRCNKKIKNTTYGTVDYCHSCLGL